MGKKVVHIIRSTAINPDPRTMKAANWLREAGYKVKVIGWDRECSNPQKEVINGIEIERIAIPGHYGAGINNVFRLLLFNIRLFFMLLFDTPNIIHACDLDTAFPALLVKKIKKTKMVYDIYDFYAESRRIGPLTPFIRYIEKVVARSSDLVILAHEERIQQLEPLPSETKARTIVIYNTPEDTKVEKKKEPFLSCPFFSYVGILTPDRALSVIIEVFMKIEKVGLVLGGFGPLEKDIEQKMLPRNNMMFLGRVDYHKALLVQGNSLAVIAMYDPSIPNNQYAAPNKLYEAMMLGKPIITSSHTLLSEIVSSEKIGYIIPYGDIASLYEVCNRIIEHPEEARLMGERARKLYEDKYSAKKMKAVLQQTYENLYT
jgi:glycosyltransferase involved in cell wall biosynthesis